jgi:HEPN domain-containing protein
LSRPEGRDLAKVLARKAEGDVKVMRRLAPDSDIDDEAIGFHAQQAIEKWLKAVMAFQGLEEARIHDLGRLLEILGEAGVDSPPGANWLDDLSIYAVPLRYADLLDAEPLDRDATLSLVDDVGEWASAQLRSSSD